MIEELLRWAGVPGKFAVLGVFAYTVYHFRHALQIAAAGMFAVKLTVVFVGVLVLGMAGVVPGFTVEVDVGALLDTLRVVAGGVWDLLPV